MAEDDFQPVLEALHEPRYRQLAETLPWPYNGMVNDIIGAVQTKGNYLAALGLACYTEICGRRIFFNGSSKTKDWKCFEKFLKYMANGQPFPSEVIIGGRQLKLFQAVRDGLAHEYFMKGGDTVISMNRESPNANYLGFLRIENGNRLCILVVVPYFRLFADSLRRANENGLLATVESADSKILGMG